MKLQVLYFLISAIVILASGSNSPFEIPDESDIAFAKNFLVGKHSIEEALDRILSDYPNHQMIAHLRIQLYAFYLRSAESHRAAFEDNVRIEADNVLSLGLHENTTSSGNVNEAQQSIILSILKQGGVELRKLSDNRFVITSEKFDFLQLKQIYVEVSLNEISLKGFNFGLKHNIPGCLRFFRAIRYPQMIHDLDIFGGAGKTGVFLKNRQPIHEITSSSSVKDIQLHLRDLSRLASIRSMPDELEWIVSSFLKWRHPEYFYFMDFGRENFLKNESYEDVFLGKNDYVSKSYCNEFLSKWESYSDAPSLQHYIEEFCDYGGNHVTHLSVHSSYFFQSMPYLGNTSVPKKFLHKTITYIFFIEFANEWPLGRQFLNTFSFLSREYSNLISLFCAIVKKRLNNEDEYVESSINSAVTFKIDSAKNASNHSDCDHDFLLNHWKGGFEDLQPQGKIFNCCISEISATALLLRSHEAIVSVFKLAFSKKLSARWFYVFLNEILIRLEPNASLLKTFRQVLPNGKGESIISKYLFQWGNFENFKSFQEIFGRPPIVYLHNLAEIAIHWPINLKLYEVYRFFKENNWFPDYLGTFPVMVGRRILFQGGHLGIQNFHPQDLFKSALALKNPDILEYLSAYYKDHLTDSTFLEDLGNHIARDFNFTFEISLENHGFSPSVVKKIKVQFCQISASDSSLFLNQNNFERIQSQDCSKLVKHFYWQILERTLLEKKRIPLFIMEAMNEQRNGLCYNFANRFNIDNIIQAIVLLEESSQNCTSVHGKTKDNPCLECSKLSFDLFGLLLFNRTIVAEKWHVLKMLPFVLPLDNFKKTLVIQNGFLSGKGKEVLTALGDMKSSRDLSSFLGKELHKIFNTEKSWDIETVRTLLKYGADPNHGNNKTERPLAVALSSQRSDLAQLMLDYGASPSKIPSQFKGRYFREHAKQYYWLARIRYWWKKLFGKKNPAV